MELRDFFKKQARVKVSQVNDASGNENRGEPSSAAHQEEEYRWENQTGQEMRSVPFSIKLDLELEQHLDETRIIKRHNLKNQSSILQEFEQG